MSLFTGIALATYLGTVGFVLGELRRAETRRTAEGRTPAQRVALAGLLAALAALMQGSATFWPGPGHFLASLSTLPVAIGVLAAPGSASAFILAATGLLFLIHAHQAAVFLLTTAPLGLTAAWSAASRRPAWLRWLLPGTTLASGIMMMVWVLGIPVFGHLAKGRGVAAATILYVVFALLYATLWVFFLRLYVVRRRFT